MRSADIPMVLIDSSILIKGQRDPLWFASIVDNRDDLATCAAAVGEFEVGLYFYFVTNFSCKFRPCGIDFFRSLWLGKNANTKFQKT